MPLKFFRFDGESDRNAFLKETAIAFGASLFILALIDIVIRITLHPEPSAINGMHVVYSDPTIITSDQADLLAKLLAAPVLIWMWLAVCVRRMRALRSGSHELG